MIQSWILPPSLKLWWTSETGFWMLDSEDSFNSSYKGKQVAHPTVNGFLLNMPCVFSFFG
jgi:hypothetical protein